MHQTSLNQNSRSERDENIMSQNPRRGSTTRSDATPYNENEGNCAFNVLKV
jgi:hypothetical protein